MVAATKKPNTEPALEYYAHITLDKIEPDMAQPRKTFDQAELVELAESIKANGVVVPIKVRPHPSKDDRFLLVAGERRWRASKLAGVADIPAIVEELNATTALEQQIIENSQRVNVPPLEEAEAYDALMKKHGYTMELLLAKTGRSKAHLYGRLKLLGLAAGAKKALQSGELAPAIAELIARIPDVKLQEKATKEVLGKGESWRAQSEAGVSSETLSDEAHERTHQPLSFRAAVQLIRRRYQTQFDLRKFDPVDTTLVAKVGACTTCPHRAGNQPALPGLTPPKGVDDDYCTNPPCFEEKVETTFKAKAEIAKSQGLKVIDGTAAKKILPYSDGRVGYDANYVDAKDELPYNIAKPGSRATFGGLLGAKLKDVPRVMVQDPNTGAARELLVKDKAIEALRQMGKVDQASKKSSSTSSTKDKAGAAKERAKRELEQETIVRVLATVAEHTIEQDFQVTSSKKWLAQLRWLARAVIRDYAQSGGDGGQAVLERRGFEDYDGLEDLVAQAKTAGEVIAPIVEMYVSIHSEARTRSYMNTKDAREFLDDGIKLFGADWDKAQAAAKEAAKAEAKADAAKESKTPAKKKAGGK